MDTIHQIPFVTKEIRYMLKIERHILKMVSER